MGFPFCCGTGNKKRHEKKMLALQKEKYSIIQKTQKAVIEEKNLKDKKFSTEMEKQIMMDKIYQNFIAFASTRTSGFGNDVTPGNEKFAIDASNVIYGKLDFGLDRNKLFPFINKKMVKFNTGKRFEICKNCKEIGPVAKPDESISSTFRVEHLEFVCNKLHNGIIDLIRNPNVKSYRIQCKEYLEELITYVDTNSQSSNAKDLITSAGEILGKAVSGTEITLADIDNFLSKSNQFQTTLKYVFRKAAKAADMNHSIIKNEAYFSNLEAQKQDFDSWAKEWYETWNGGYKQLDGVMGDVLSKLYNIKPPKCVMGYHLKDRLAYYMIRMADQEKMERLTPGSGFKKGEKECLKKLIQFCTDAMQDLRNVNLAPENKKDMENLIEKEKDIAEQLRKFDTELMKFNKGPYAVDAKIKPSYKLTEPQKGGSKDGPEPMEGNGLEDFKKYVAVRMLIKDQNGNTALYLPDGSVYRYYKDGSFESINPSNFRYLVTPIMENGEMCFQKTSFPPKGSPLSTIKYKCSAIGCKGNSIDRSDQFMNAKLVYENGGFKWSELRIKLPKDNRAEQCDKHRSDSVEPSPRYVTYRTVTISSKRPDDEYPNLTVQYVNGDQSTVGTKYNASCQYASTQSDKVDLQRKQKETDWKLVATPKPEQVDSRDLSLALKKIMLEDQEQAKKKASQKPTAVSLAQIKKGENQEKKPDYQPPVENPLTLDDIAVRMFIDRRSENCKEVIYPNGTSVKYYADGRRVRTDPTGDITIHTLEPQNGYFVQKYEYKKKGRKPKTIQNPVEIPVTFTDDSVQTKITYDSNNNRFTADVQPLDSPKVAQEDSIPNKSKPKHVVFRKYTYDKEQKHLRVNYNNGEYRVYSKGQYKKFNSQGNLVLYSDKRNAKNALHHEYNDAGKLTRTSRYQITFGGYNNHHVKDSAVRTTLYYDSSGNCKNASFQLWHPKPEMADLPYDLRQKLPSVKLAKSS